MKDSQREAMYNAWASNKTFLDVNKVVTLDSVIVSTSFKNKKYYEECFNKECYGSSDPYNIAFSRLLMKMKNIDKNIELKYE